MLRHLLVKIINSHTSGASIEPCTLWQINYFYAMNIFGSNILCNNNPKVFAGIGSAMFHTSFEHTFIFSGSLHHITLNAINWNKFGQSILPNKREFKKNQVPLLFQHFPKGKQMLNFHKGRLLPKWPKNKKFNLKFSFKL